MIFRQLFGSASGTYSYLLASPRGGEALIIDPVIGRSTAICSSSTNLISSWSRQSTLTCMPMHITGLGALRDRTHCITVMGEQSKVDVVSMRVSDGDRLHVEGVSLDVLYTPGHT